MSIQTTLPDQTSIQTILPDQMSIQGTLPDHMSIQTMLPDQLSIQTTLPNQFTRRDRTPSSHTTGCRVDRQPVQTQKRQISCLCMKLNDHPAHGLPTWNWHWHATHGFYHTPSSFLQQTKRESHIMLCCHLVLLCFNIHLTVNHFFHLSRYLKQNTSSKHGNQFLYWIISSVSAHSSKREQQPWQP
jgi:hypothetical protein